MAKGNAKIDKRSIAEKLNEGLSSCRKIVKKCNSTLRRNSTRRRSRNSASSSIQHSTPNQHRGKSTRRQS